MSKLVVLKIGEGSCDQGYPVTLQIGDDGATPNVSLDGKLPPCAEIQPASVCLPIQYATWQSEYRQKLSSARMKKSSVQKTSSSNSALIDSSKILKQHLNDWLNSEAFRPIKDKFQQKINPDDMVRVIIQTDDPNLRRLPWYLWDLFASYRFAEVALYAPAFEGVKQSVQPKAKVRILAILGDASAPDRITGIKLDIEADKRFLASLPNAELVFLAEPELNRQKFTEQLWDEKGWDILFFAGHSSSEPDGTTGKMFINSQDGLTIPELKSALQKAIERGLQLAIFNSCDGLGIARDLADLHIPHVIVMREPVPDLVAKEFLQHFLTFFAGGKSLYLAVREARERLEALEKVIPCASWLPVICQNPAHLPPTWNDLRGVESGINWREFCQNALAERQRLTTNPLTTGDGVEFTFDDIYVPLGLVEKVKKEKRPGEISPEEGSQFYQPEEVTRTYKNDEFFAQVLKQGQSPKSQGRRLAVTGEPGAGKTTLLQKIAQWVATETERDVAIWVSLADLQGRTVEEYLLQKWLKDFLGAVRVTPEMEDALASLFKSGRVWLLLDGVDEMGADGNPLATVKSQISGWVASARVVVTCRQNVWDAGKNALEGFDVYRNLDFDYPEGVGQFIHRWFARHPELGERLLAELAQDGKERIRDTVRNPLRLALLCRAWQIRQGGLPETKAGLYGQFVEKLYEWKQEAFPTTEDEQEELNAALGRLALRGMEQPESRFRLKEGLVREILGKKDKPPFSLALQLGWLNLVGVAVENPDERVYAFYHPTFQEYFAALAVDDWGYFLPKNHKNSPVEGKEYRIFQPQWKEVILLWFGRGNVQKEKKEAFIEKLINFDDGCVLYWPKYFVSSSLFNFRNGSIFGNFTYLFRNNWYYLNIDRGFYEYQAYFLAGAIVSEFKESSFTELIINQIVAYSCGLNAQKYRKIMLYIPNDYLFDNKHGKIKVIKHGMIDTLIGIIVKFSAGYFDTQNHRLMIFLEPIEESAKAILSETVRGLVVARLIEISKMTKVYDVVYVQGVSKIHEIISELNKNTLSDRLNSSEQVSDNEHSVKQANSGKYADKQTIKHHRKITSLLHQLDQEPEHKPYNYSHEQKKLNIIRKLSEIGEGNDLVIIRLIQEYFCLEKTTYYSVITEELLKCLSKIAVGNETAINRLIQILDESLDESLDKSKILPLILDKTSEINSKKYLDKDFYKLIQCLSENKFISKYVDYSLSKIRASCDDGAVIQFIQILKKKSSNKSIQKMVVDILGEIKVENTRILVIKLLGKIAIGNERAISRLIQLLDEVKFSRHQIPSEVADNLGEMAVGNENAILRLIQLLDETSDKDTHTRKSVVQSLGKIAAGNQLAINRLIKLLDEDEVSQNSTVVDVVESLGKIATGNQLAINRLSQMLGEISYTPFQILIAENLMKIRSITNKVSYFQIVIYFKNNLLNPIQYENLNYYQKSYKLLWQCAHNVNYPEFYEAWHSKINHFYKNRRISKYLLSLIQQFFLLALYLSKKIILFAALVMMIAIILIIIISLGILRIFVSFVQ